METFVLLPPEGADPDEIVNQLDWFCDRNPDVPITVVVDEPATRILAVIALGEESDFSLPLGWSI